MKNLLLIAICFLSLTACQKKANVPPEATLPDRNKVLGNWSAKEQVSGITKAMNYQISIAASDLSKESISITNLHNMLTSAVSGYVSGDSLYIPTQTVDGYTVFGAGIFHSSAATNSAGMTMSYEITNATSVIASYGYNGNPTSEWGD